MEEVIRELTVRFLCLGAAFSLIWSVAILVSRRGYREQRTLAGMIFLAGIWQVSGALAFSGIGQRQTGLLLWQSPLLFYLGPLIYRFYRGALLQHAFSRRSMVVHALPAVLCAAALVPYWSAEPARRIAWLSQDGSVYAWVLVLVNVGPKLSILAYLTFVAAQLLRSVLPAPRTTARRLLILKLAVIYATLALGTIGILTANRVLVHLSAAALPIIVIVSFILSEGVPELFSELGRRARTYERTRLASIPIGETREALRRLMEEERVFLDEDLTLPRLADDVGLTAHQLSEFLNRHVERSFPEFVAEYRVEEAKRLLVSEPSRSTLSVGHAAGFNSKSAFYRAFRRATGRDPSEFRRERLSGVPV